MAIGQGTRVRLDFGNKEILQVDADTLERGP